MVGGIAVGRQLPVPLCQAGAPLGVVEAVLAHLLSHQLGVAGPEGREQVHESHLRFAVSLRQGSRSIEDLGGFGGVPRPLRPAPVGVEKINHV